MAPIAYLTNARILLREALMQTALVIYLMVKTWWKPPFRHEKHQFH